jgi:hypothetical protein
VPELVAILCSGQGAQHPAMFDLVANCPEAEPVFAAAAAVLGRDPRRFVKEALAGGSVLGFLRADSMLHAGFRGMGGARCGPAGTRRDRGLQYR